MITASPTMARGGDGGNEMNIDKSQDNSAAQRERITRQEMKQSQHRYQYQHQNRSQVNRQNPTDTDITEAAENI
jgi:hypothetical protein